MTERPRLKVEEYDLIVRGFALEELLSKEFWSAFQREFPKAALEHVCFELADPKGRIAIGYERVERKTIRDYVLVGGSPTTAGFPRRVVKVLEEVRQ